MLELDCPFVDANFDWRTVSSSNRVAELTTEEGFVNRVNRHKAKPWVLTTHFIKISFKEQNMAKELHEITDYSVFTYPNEIIVELWGQTADGEFTTISYQFELTSSGTKRVQPRDPVDDAHEDTIYDALSEAGYELVST